MVAKGPVAFPCACWDPPWRGSAWRRWAMPFTIYGMNAIAAFVIGGLVTRLFYVIKIGEAGQQVNLYAFLKDHAGVTVFECKLEDLLPKPNKRVKEGIQGAGLLLVTSQEIDELCEADNIAQARLQVDAVLGQLRRGTRILSEHGIKTIILVADHGHLFTDEIGEDMKIEAPGGKTEDLHRRV